MAELTERGESSFDRPTDIWTYRAQPNWVSNHEVGVVDGDTYDLIIDLGFHMWSAQRVRAMHLDTAETYGVGRDTKEYEIGVKQTQFACEWIREAIQIARRSDEIPEEWPILVRTERKTGKYGRWLGEIFNWEGESLEAALIDEFGEEYFSDPK